MRNRRSLLAIVLLISVLTIGSISAYFTDGDTATNTFVVGNISLDLQEPNWDPDDAKDVVPNEEITKDPQIKNDGTNEEYVFMQVLVPYANVVACDDDGTAKAAADTELFTYTVGSGWFEFTSPVKDSDNNVMVHTYAYGDATACTALAKDATTPALFEKVKVANIVEGQDLSAVNTNLVINAFGIQTANIDGGKVKPDDIWLILSKQLPSTAQDATVTEDAKTDIKQ